MGLENLAFAYSVEEVKLHGAFLQQLLAPVNGFIILDLHNLYCQLHNFQVDFEEIVAYYPLEMVREIHISGGTWDEQPALFSLKIRRDTHDDAVPATVFELLKKTLPRCPNVKYVVLEQLGTALQTTIEQENYRNDFDKMRQIVKNFNKTNQKAPKWHDFLPFGNTALSDEPIEDALLHAEQLTLSAILENATSIEQATEALQKSSLRNSAWKIESWQPYMLQTAIDIAQKWKAKAYELK
jgi:hypothetical protein